MVAPAPFALKHLDDPLASELPALQRSAYRIEAELLGTDRIPARRGIGRGLVEAVQALTERGSG